VQLVSLEDTAWHAGISALPQLTGQSIRGCNSLTLGIELDNLGPLVLDPEGEPGFWFEEGNALKPYEGLPPVEATLAWTEGPRIHCFWEPYAEPQLEALAKLLVWLAEVGHRDAVHNLVGHEEVALPAGRKRDPGPLFPWARFARRLPRRTSSLLVQHSPDIEDAVGG
jgi:N-acetyl-anhydromuramyl-L-alanine amidase AmpD